MKGGQPSGAQLLHMPSVELLPACSTADCATEHDRTPVRIHARQTPISQWGNRQVRNLLHMPSVQLLPECNRIRSHARQTPSRPGSGTQLTDFTLGHKTGW